MSDWWARKMGGAPTTPQRQQPPAGPLQGEERYTYQQAPPPQTNGEIQLTMENFGQALGHWKGGEGRRNSTTCPQCGTDNLFRRKVGAQEAAPLCYHCGFNGMYQQGDPANWQQ